VRAQLLLSVTRRAVPAGLVVAAAFADASGSPRLAFYALLALVPVAAAVALGAYGDLVEEPLSPEDSAPRSVQALCWGLLVVLAVVGAAARAPSIGQAVVPKLAATALIACVVLLCVEGLVELVGQARRPRVRRPGRLEEEPRRVAGQVY
jgi:hypothetical protein